MPKNKVSSSSIWNTKITSKLHLSKSAKKILKRDENGVFSKGLD